MAKREISIVLRAKNAMAAGLAKAGESLKSFGKSAARIGKAFTVAFLAAGTAVAGFAAKAVAAYAKQESAEKLAADALRAHGEEVNNSMAMIRKHASAIQDETGAADENTIATMARLRILGVETSALGEAARATLALKSAGMEESAAIKAVAMARAGEFTMLQRYIPALRQASGEAEKARIVNDFLAKGYEQQKGQLNTVAGQWAALKGRVGDVWEEIGKAIAQNAGLVAILQRAGDAVKAFGQRISDWVAGGGITATIEIVKGAFDEMRKRIQMVIDAKVDIAVGLITAAVAALAIKIAILAKGSALLSLKMNKAAISAGIKAASLKVLGAASAGAAAKVALLKAAVVALQAAGIGAIAVGFAAIARSALQAAEASRQLSDSMAKLKHQEEQSKKKWGVGSHTLKKIRLAYESGDVETLEKLNRLYPEAMAKIKAHREALKQQAESVDEVTTAVEEQAQAFTIAAAKTEDAQDEVKDALDDTKEKVKELEQAREDAANRTAALEKERADKEKQEREKALNDEIAGLEKIKKKREELAAKRVADIIAEAKEKKDLDKELAREAKKAAELEGRVERGAKLSKGQQEWLDAFRKIQGAQKGLGKNDPIMEQLAVAKDNLLQLKNDARTMKDILGELQVANQDQKKLANDLTALLRMA